MADPTQNCAQCANLGSTLRCSKCKEVFYCNSICQRKHWKTHKRMCVVDESYSITEVEGKGKGMIAKRNIAKGEIIIEEKVAFKIHNRDLLVDMIDPTNQEVAKLSDKKKKLFYDLNDPNLGGNEKMKALRIYENNCLTDGLFLIISRINHSCKPNALWSSDDDVTQEVRALRDINAGEEITSSYLRQSTFRTHKERREALKKWRFDCSCEVCILKGNNLEENDSMRLKIRRIHLEVESFMDQVSAVGIMNMRSKIKDVFNSANVNREYAERLGIECGAFSVNIYNQLHTLSMFAKVMKIELENGQAPNAYKMKARQLANEFGKMFESNCATNERSVDSIAY